MKLFGTLVLTLFILTDKPALAQDSTSLYNKLYNFPDRVFNGIQSKMKKTESLLNKQTGKYLQKLERREKKLRNKLQKTDSLKAKELFGDIDTRYATLREKLKGTSTSYSNIYNGHADSINTVLQFMQQHKDITKGVQDKLQAASGAYKQLQSQLAQTEQIKSLLKQRQQLLKQQLENTPLAKEFRKFQKDVYYYRAQMDEYKNMLSDPSKLEARLLKLANKIPAFKDFFAKHSQLASLFSLPDNYGSMASLQGLQARNYVMSMINQRVAAGGPGAQQMIQQNLADAQSQLQQLKTKLNQLGQGGGDIDMPGFKPNNQRTRSFFRRLEFGTNIQTQKAQYYFPTTSDLGLSVGYKLNDKSIIGIGASYKLGLGSGWNNIKFTNQGAGLRSFVEWKLKGSFYASGGYEGNYRSTFRNIAQLKDESAWQQSALLGISKKYSISKAFKGNIQLLYDFLHTRQVPRTQPIVFRLGYTLK